MNKAAKRFTFWGAANGALAVIAGAFGAHSLQSQLSARHLEIFELAARYQLIHALALFAVAWMAAQALPRAELAGWLLLAGIAVFSGSLYALALTKTNSFGAITPIGGIALILGWSTLAYSAIRTKTLPSP